ncbi:MAG: hypothetical protein NTW14_14490 [bacterium]|nr:hypothetical protein [bacterium]
MTPSEKASDRIRSKSKLWIITILALVMLVVLGGFLTAQTDKMIDDQHKGILSSQAKTCTGDFNEKLGAIEGELIALAEQRGLREGIAKGLKGKINRDWDDGFLQAMDAACLAMPARGAGILRVTLRDVEGKRLAGSGLEIIQVNVPDPGKRIRKEMLSREGEAFIEEWTVPVRDATAQPVAYLVAEVDYSVILSSILTSAKLDSGMIIYLTDQAWKLLWINVQNVSLPTNVRQMQQIDLNGKNYTIISEPIAGKSWTLNFAHPQTKRNFVTDFLFSKNLAVIASMSVVLILITILFTKRRKVY